jgi:hypothetical protein
MTIPPAPLPPLPAVPLGRYRHYKGGEYEVLGVVRHSESLEPLVLYRPLYNASGLWVRPHAMFLETVEVDGAQVPRFAPVVPAVPAVPMSPLVPDTPDAPDFPVAPDTPNTAAAGG